MSHENSLVGYAILKANYDYAEKDYLASFMPFVLIVVESEGRPYVKHEGIGEKIAELFGISIPNYVVRKIIKNAVRAGKLKRRDGGEVALASDALDEVGQLKQQWEEFYRRQNELVDAFWEYNSEVYGASISMNRDECAELLYGYFDKKAVDLVKIGPIDPKHSALGLEGAQYVVSRFIQHLHDSNDERFSYVIEAAKGVMLASVLDFESEGFSHSLARLEIVLDTPIVLDALGYHGDAPKLAMRRVLEMAQSESVRLVIFDHTLDEIDAILQGVECDISSVRQSYGSHKVFRYFLDSGFSKSDIVVIRTNLESNISDIGVSIIQRPPYDSQSNLDERLLEDSSQKAVRYRARGSRINDVHSLAAVYRMRRSSVCKTFERCKALFVTSNPDVVRGALCVEEVHRKRMFPLALTVEDFASLLWVRGGALSEDVPRMLVMASAYAGMRPNELLWKKYLAVLSDLEKRGGLDPKDVVALRSANLVDEVLMHETLGNEKKLNGQSVKEIVEEVKRRHEEPLRRELADVSENLRNTQGKLADALANGQDATKEASQLSDALAAQEQVASEMRKQLQAYADKEAEREKARELVAVRRVGNIFRALRWGGLFAGLALFAWLIYVSFFVGFEPKSPVFVASLIGGITAVVLFALSWTDWLLQRQKVYIARYMKHLADAADGRSA